MGRKKSGLLLPDEEQALRVLVRDLPVDPVIVNIGAGMGLSSFAMLDERPDAVIFSIDINPGRVEKHDGLEWRRIIGLLGRSQEIGLHWPLESVDLVYVDGSHLLEDVRDDISVWLFTIRDEGVMVLHDHSPPKPRRETPRQLEQEAWVTQAAEEMLFMYDVMTHVNRLKAWRVEWV